MALFDLPLEQLQTYGGVNPCPPDFDQYWEKALKELQGVAPCPELKPAAFQVPFAECFDLYFTGVGGARIHARYLQPRQAAAPHPAVLMFHGYSANAGDWSDKLNFVALGFSVAALDCRGQGGSSEDTGSIRGTTIHGHIIRGIDDAPEKLLFRQIFLDTAQLAQVVINLPGVDKTKIGTIGGSQGGGLSLACASLVPEIKRCVAHFPYLLDYKRIWDLELTGTACEELRYYFRTIDPLHERETEIFTKLGYIDVQYLVKRIKAEVLLVTGLMDTTCPPSIQFAAYNKITAPKQMKIYPDYGHEWPYPQYGDITYNFLAEL